MAKADFQSQSLRPHIEELVAKEVTKECKNLCSLRQPLILHSASKDAVVKFSWEAVCEEFKNRTPLFYKVLLAGAGKVWVSLVQYITGSILKMGKTSKQVDNFSCTRSPLISA